MAGFAFPADTVSALERRLQGMIVAGEAARTAVRREVYDEAVSRAQTSTRWADLAEHLEVWDENDRFWVGVRSPQFVSEAFAAEYGTEEYPPEPILRQLDGAARLAAHRSRGHVVAANVGAV